MYQVSNLGRIKSLKYGKERIMSGGIDKAGYNTVALYKNNIGKTYKVHQLVAIHFLNHIPNGMNIVIDHIDLNKLNNNVHNLRIVSQRENSNKKHIKSSSSFVGVSWDKFTGKWKSKIVINGKTKHLGRFTDELEAFNAYQTALKTI